MNGEDTVFVPYTPPRPISYDTIGEPITVSTRETSREELRISWTQRDGEDAPRVDLRYFTIRSDGSATPHRGGLRLTAEEAAQLRDALNGMTDL